MNFSEKYKKQEFLLLITIIITQTKDNFDEYYNVSAPLAIMVTKWFTDYHCSRTSSSDSEIFGRPIEVRKPKTIEKIHVCEIMEVIGMSHVAVSIVKDY